MLLSHFLQRKLILHFVWIQTSTQREACAFVRWGAAGGDCRDADCYGHCSLGKKSPSLFAANNFEIK